MKLYSVVGKAILVLAALVLLPGMAAACCSSTLCPTCVSSSNNCVCGNQMPVCNIFACNCNNQCGAFTYATNNLCYFSTPCDSSAAKADAQARFNEVDANKDGKISQDETWAWSQKQTRSLVANKSELPQNLTAAGAKAQDTVTFGFKKADANGDGSITPAEFDSSLGTPAKK
jgi:hypothetical protein